MYDLTLENMRGLQILYIFSYKFGLYLPKYIE